MPHSSTHKVIEDYLLIWTSFQTTIGDSTLVISKAIKYKNENVDSQIQALKLCVDINNIY